MQLKKCVIILKNIKYCSQYAQQGGGQSAADCAAQSIQQFSSAIQLHPLPAPMCEMINYLCLKNFSGNNSTETFQQLQLGQHTMRERRMQTTCCTSKNTLSFPHSLPLACMFIPLTLTCLHLRPLPVYDFMLQSMANCANCLNDFAWVNNLHDLLRPSTPLRTPPIAIF